MPKLLEFLIKIISFGANLLNFETAFQKKKKKMRNLSMNVVGLTVMLLVSFSGGFTDPRDVFAINNLYAALGSPPLLGWIPLGGDPCLEAWQGVLCVNSNVTGISLSGANLGGQLGTGLDSFISIISIDLSGNHIGGTIPGNLPSTMKTFILSANQFTGSIPDLSALSQLTDLSLNKNNLTGEIPDSFQQLKGLISLDLSENNITGPLPPSMGNLSSLTTLHLQENKLTGTLNVLQNLPLSDLNIENNQFSGPIPPNLLTVPNFRSSGNPFNTTILTSPPASSPALEPSAHEPPNQPADSQSAPETSSSTKSAKFSMTKTIICAAAVAVFILIIVVLGFWFCLTRYCKRRPQASDGFSEGPVKNLYEAKEENFKLGESLPQTNKQAEKVFQETSVKISDMDNGTHEQVTDVKQAAPVSMRKDVHSIDMMGTDVSSIPIQPTPPPRHFSSENITLEPITPPVASETKNPTFPNSVKSLTVASLQQYTNSFSEENLIGEGLLGCVYRAELPDGKLVAVKKINDTLRLQGEEEFAQIVSVLSKIQHANVVKLLGYCSEYGQRLLVHEHCSNGTLYDALHLDDEIHKSLSWNVRVKIALGAARALEYLHEVCQPSIVHKNFKSNNILLDDEFEPLISDCGLAPLLSDGFTTQLSGGYGAPELELGTYTHPSDVFSFGVVMLELLTGRKPYDRTLPRGEQFLVRWAIPQLHDIDALSKMVDPSLKGSYPSKSLSRFADIISLCVQAEPEFRPPMSEIVESLLNMMERES